MNWCFGKVNNKLAEIYFEKKKEKIKFLGHCFVKKDEYTSKKEQSWIDKDVKNVNLEYSNGVYIQILSQ